jgi:hypothetical protein
MHSPDHSTKGTPSALGGTLPQWPLTAGEYVVSGSVSSPSRGAFHLSLTVLVHYRSLTVFSLGEWSPPLPTRLHVSRGTQDASPPSPPDGYGILTLSDRSFQSVPLGRVSILLVLQPRDLAQRPRFGLLPFRSPLLRESRLISVRRATEMFQFTHCLLTCLWIQQVVSSHHTGWVAPFGYSGLLACMQLPLNVSPVSASFFSRQHLGIHLVLCLACSRWLRSRVFTHPWSVSPLLPSCCLNAQQN